MITRSTFLEQPRSLPDNYAKWSLVIAIFFVPISHGVAYIFMALCLLAWLIAGGYRQRFAALRSHAFAWSTLTLLLLILLGVLYSTGDTSDINRHVSKYAKLAFIPLAITLLQEERWRRYGLNAFTLAMGITLTISMLSLFMEIPFMKGDSGSLNGNHYVFKDHIAQNLMMAFFVMIMMVKGHAESRRKYRLAYWGVALIAMINIMAFVHGRTGYLALAVILTLFIFLQVSPRRRWQSLLMFIIAAAVLLPFADGFRGRIERAMNELQTHQPDKVTSVGARIEMAKASLELIQERPLIGWGTGSYPKQFCERAITEEMCAVGGYHPHNQFLSFGVQLGLLGILAYLAFLATVVWQTRYFDHSQKTLAFGLLGALLIDSLLHAPFFLVGESQFFILMLAVVLAQNQDQAGH